MARIFKPKASQFSWLPVFATMVSNPILASIWSCWEWSEIYTKSPSLPRCPALVAVVSSPSIKLHPWPSLMKNRDYKKENSEGFLCQFIILNMICLTRCLRARLTRMDFHLGFYMRKLFAHLERQCSHGLLIGRHGGWGDGHSAHAANDGFSIGGWGPLCAFSTCVIWKVVSKAMVHNI